MNSIKNRALHIKHVVIPKGKRTGIRVPLHIIEKPFARITRLGFPLEIFSFARRQIRASDTIVCVNDAIGFATLFWKWVGFIRANIVVVIQSLPERYKYFHKHERIVKFTKSLLKRASVVLTLSDIAQTQLTERFDVKKEKMTTFRFGVDVSFWKPLRHPKHKNYVFTIGNDMNRDIQTLYSALERADTLVHVSNNPIADNNSKGIIRSLTNIPDKHVRQLYREAGVVIIPSISLVYESSGLSTILQAMACGRPVIASYIPTLDEILTNKENVLFYNPESVKDLKRKINWARKHPKKLEKIAQNGYNLVQENYTTQHMGAQWERILNE